MPSQGRPLARAPTDTQRHTDRKTGTRYTLATYLEVMAALSSHPDHAVLDSALWYEARFSLKPVEREGKGKSKRERGKSVGHLYAYVVDKTKVDEENGGLAWIRECLAPAPAPKAKGRKKVKVVQEEEMTELQIVLGELKGYDVRAGTPVVLSPAGNGDARVDNGKTDVEIERGLVRSYRGSGFAVWSQGLEEVEGSVTVMGRVVPEAEEDGDGAVDEAEGVEDEVGAEESAREQERGRAVKRKVGLRRR